MKNRLFAILLLAFAAISLNAQMLTPIVWSSSIEMKNDKEGVLSYSATVEPGWHLYATKLEEGGPKPTKIEYSKLVAVQFPNHKTSHVKFARRNRRDI